LLCFATAALVWAMLWGFPLEPGTGLTVTGLCFLGIVGYVAALALEFHAQNRRLVSARNGLRASEEQFRFIAEHAGDMVSVLTPEYCLRYASPSHTDYFNPDQFADGRNWLDLVFPEDRDKARAFLESLRTATSKRRAHLRVVPAKGSWRVLECQGNPVRAPGGELQMIVMVCRDLGRWLDANDAGSAESQPANKIG